MDEGEERERKKKREVAGEVFHGLYLPCWLCCGLQLLGAIKG
jgi:hypothetical protein